MSFNLSLNQAKNNMSVLHRSNVIFTADEKGNISAISRFNFLGRFFNFIKNLLAGTGEHKVNKVILATLKKIDQQILESPDQLIWTYSSDFCGKDFDVGFDKVAMRILTDYSRFGAYCYRSPEKNNDDTLVKIREVAHKILLMATEQRKIYKMEFDCDHLPCEQIRYLTPLKTPEEISKLHCQEIVHELCGIDLNGNTRKYSLERLKAILGDLKQRNLLPVLNTIPQYYHDHEAKPQTPLNYWIEKGDLEAVKLLVQHGAALEIEEGDSSFPWNRDIFKKYKFHYERENALFYAALLGKEEIVQFLLSKRSSADYAFRNNLLRSFIPTFIYYLSTSIEDYHDRDEDKLAASIACLEKILESLPAKQLATQLAIPIAQYDNGKRLNSIAWVKEIQWYTVNNRQRQQIECTSPAKQSLISLLEKYSAKETDVMSINDVSSLGNVGAGLTLYEASCLK